jgi:hypothetical protein
MSTSVNLDIPFNHIDICIIASTPIFVTLLYPTRFKGIQAMAPHVEANSLSDITQLASNPPKYPLNPTEPRRESLTLYIARVPGSKGWFSPIYFRFHEAELLLRYHPHNS